MYYINNLNCFLDEASLECLKIFEPRRNAMIMAQCMGYPFRGNPKEMAADIISHILKRVSSEVGLFPVVLQSNSGTDCKGEYTTEVVFQVVA